MVGDTTVEKYIAALPDGRRETIESVRQVIRSHLSEGYVEEMGFGMITYVIPLEDYPETYNGQPLMYAALASHKNYMSLYLMNVYGDPEAQEWFTEGFKARGKKLNMGKSCVRFKKLDDLPMDVIGSAIGRANAAEWIAIYEESRAHTAKGRRRRDAG